MAPLSHEKVAEPSNLQRLRGAIIFDGVDRRAELPENETVSVEFTPRRTGLITFGCHRGTLRGHVIVVD